MHGQTITDPVPGRLARLRHHLSQTRHGTHPIRWYGLGFAGAALTPPAPAGWDRLITMHRGAALARGPRTLVSVAPGCGVLVGPATPVVLHAPRQVELRILYVPASGAREARAVTVTPLLQALVERIVARGALDAREPRDARLIAVVLDELDALAAAPFTLALPAERRALRAAELMLAHDGAPLTLNELAACAGTSARTLERVFARETGCGVARWQRRARLLAAQRALADGGSVTEGAFDAGYASPSAFIAAFRAAFGATPGRSRAQRASVSSRSGITDP